MIQEKVAIETTAPSTAASKWASLAGLLVLPLSAAFSLVAGLLTPDYSHIAHTMSQLGAKGRPYSELMNAGFIIYGLLVLTLAYGLYKALESNVSASVIAALLTINGIGIITTGFFQTGWDHPDAPVPFLGSAVHQVAARVAFLSLLAAILIFPSAAGRQRWGLASPFSFLIFALAALSGLFFLLDFWPDMAGLIQRFFLGFCMLWITLVSLRLYRLSKAPRRFVFYEEAYQNS